MRAIWLFFLMICLGGNAQEYPKDYFESPLRVPLLLNGTFGELRSNHFHAGLDINTQRKIGLPVYASADGVVNRIRIGFFGYGKGLYLRHDNGYTTVYAHLEKYAGAIESFVKKAQYEQQLFEVELFPTANEIRVKKGELIGYTGNTGGSAGPHLHFEIRDTDTEEPINPFLFGFDALIADTEKPVLNDLSIYPLDVNTVINGVNAVMPLSLRKQADGTYLADVQYVTGTVGFAVNAYDTFDKSFAKNGVYRITQKVNGSVVYEFKADRFAFDEARMVNYAIDYKPFP